MTDNFRPDNISGVTTDDGKIEIVKSELLQILTKNAIGILSGEEFLSACMLIVVPKYSLLDCFFCYKDWLTQIVQQENAPENEKRLCEEKPGLSKAIYDTRLCQHHAALLLSKPAHPSNILPYIIEG